MALYAHSPSRTGELSAPRRPRENIIYLRQNSDHSLYFFFSTKSKARQGKVLLAPTVRWLETGLRRMSSYELAGHVRSGGARGAASSIIVEHMWSEFFL
jgi:hypothetical protein